MPVRPKPFTQACPRCNWTKTFSPATDVLTAGRDLAVSCPRCGSTALKIEEASVFARVASRLKRLLT